MAVFIPFPSTPDTAPRVTTGVVAATIVHDIIVDTSVSSKFLVTIEEEAAPANKIIFGVSLVHNGTASADATSVYHSAFGVVEMGAALDYTLTSSLTGTGAAQEANILIASTSAGVTVSVKSIETVGGI